MQGFWSCKCAIVHVSRPTSIGQALELSSDWIGPNPLPGLLGKVPVLHSTWLFLSKVGFWAQRGSRSS